MDHLCDTFMVLQLSLFNLYFILKLFFYINLHFIYRFVKYLTYFILLNDVLMFNVYF